MKRAVVLFVLAIAELAHAQAPLKTGPINANGDVTSTGAVYQSTTQRVFSIAGTGLSSSGATVSLAINGGVAQPCPAGQVIVQVSGTGLISCATLGSLGSISGSLTAGKVPVATGPAALGDSDIADNTTTHVVTLGGLSTGTSASMFISAVSTASDPSLFSASALRVVAGSGGSSFFRPTADANGSLIALIKTRSPDPGTRTVVLNGDQLGKIRFNADDGTNYTTAAELRVVVNGTVATGSVPSDYVFGVGPGAASEAFRIKSDQSLVATVSSTNTTFAGTTSDALWLTNTSNTTNNYNEIQFNDHSGIVASEIAAKYIDQTNHYGWLQFGTRGAAAGFVERMRIDDTGLLTAFYGINANSQKIASVANGTLSTDAVNLGQVSGVAGATITSSVSGRAAVYNGALSLTGYAGFTSDASGNVGVNSLIGAGTVQAHDFYANGAQGTTAALKMESTSSPASNGFELRIRDLIEGDFEIYDQTTGGKPIYVDAGDGTTLQKALTAGTFTLTAGYQNTTLKDTESAAVGVGAALEFDGAYTGSTTTGGALIKAMKSNSVAGDYGFDLVFGARANGVADVPKGLVLASDGVTTMLGQGLGVGGLYQGQALDMGDVLASGLTLKNYSTYTDEGGNSTDTDVAWSSNAGWGHRNGANTCTYSLQAASSSIHSPQAFLKSDGATWTSNTPMAGAVGKIVATGSDCDWREVSTSTETKVSDLKQKTVTLTAWLQTGSGTASNVQLMLGRYNDNNQTSVVCPTINSTSPTPCTVTATFNNTVLTNDSELRRYITPGGAITLYVMDVDTEFSAVRTPYVFQTGSIYPNDWTTATIPLAGSSASGASLPTAVNPSSVTGTRVYALGVGWQGNGSPPAYITKDGNVIAPYASFGTRVDTPTLGTNTSASLTLVTNATTAITVNTSQQTTFANRVDFGKAGAISYTGLTNAGALDYDTTNHNLVLSAQASSTTSHVLIATSNTATAATQLDVGPTGVSVPGTLAITGLTTHTGGTTQPADLKLTSTAHFRTQGTGVTLTNGACNSTTCNDVSGTVTTTSTTLTITFAATYTGADDASCILQEMGGTVVPTFTTSATALTATVVVSGAKYHYFCPGH